MIVVPYSTEVLIKRWPVSNLILMGLSIVVFLLLLTGGISEPVIEVLILHGWAPAGMIGHQFLHGGFLHLGFNMLYLWVFGNAVCEKVGSVRNAIVYLAGGLAAAVVHNVFDGEPAIGASGAINAMVGFYLVLYPVNRVNCFFWFFRGGTFAMSGGWLILIWFVLDLWFALRGAAGGIAYWAHVGGFVSGVAMGVLFLKVGWAKMDHYDNPTLLDYLFRQKQTGTVGQWRKSPPGSRPVSPRPPLPAPQPDTVIPVPRITFDCPHCGHGLEVPEDWLGRVIHCPSCRKEIDLQEE